MSAANTKPSAHPSPCRSYEGDDLYGKHKNGNPCIRCRWPEGEHSSTARDAWTARPSVIPGAMGATEDAT